MIKQAQPQRIKTKRLSTYSRFVLVALVIVVASLVFIKTIDAALYPPSEDQTAAEIPAPSYSADNGINTINSTSTLTTSATSASSTATSTKKVLAGVTPSKLSIPSLKINANIENVGITAKNSIASPSSFSTVGWYKYSPKPGDPGMTLIDGHVNNGLGLAGVFSKLNSISIGDDIYVTDPAGKKLHFVVTSTSSLAYTDHLDALLTQQTSKAQLVLMTCDGTWVPAQKTYDRRIIVVADLAQ